MWRCCTQHILKSLPLSLQAGACTDAVWGVCVQHQGLQPHLPHYVNAILSATNAQMHFSTIQCAV